MRTLVDVAFTVLKITIIAMISSMVLFIVAWMCHLDVWVAVTVAIMTIAIGIIVNKLTKGVY